MRYCRSENCLNFSIIINICFHFYSFPIRSYGLSSPVNTHWKLQFIARRKKIRSFIMKKKRREICLYQHYVVSFIINTWWTKRKILYVSNIIHTHMRTEYIQHLPITRQIIGKSPSVCAFFEKWFFRLYTRINRHTVYHYLLLNVFILV